MLLQWLTTVVDVGAHTFLPFLLCLLFDRNAVELCAKLKEEIVKWDEMESTPAQVSGGGCGGGGGGGCMAFLFPVLFFSLSTLLHELTCFIRIRSYSFCFLLSNRPEHQTPTTRWARR